MNHKKFQSSGKEAAAATTQVIQPFFFFLFISCKVALAVCFSLCFFFSHLTCLNEEEETFGLLFPGSSSRRWATFGTLCCSSSVLNAQRRKSRPTRRQAVDVPLVLMITVSCVCFVFFLLPYLRLKGHSAVPRTVVLLNRSRFCFSYALKRRSPQRQPTDRLNQWLSAATSVATPPPRGRLGKLWMFRKPQSPE